MAYHTKRTVVRTKYILHFNYILVAQKAFVSMKNYRTVYLIPRA